jgi:hypothetical protein
VRACFLTKGWFIFSFFDGRSNNARNQKYALIAFAIIFLFINSKILLDILKLFDILYSKYYLNTNLTMKNLKVSFEKSISIDSDKVFIDNKKQIVFI